jgi:hypothetical protein
MVSVYPSRGFALFAAVAILSMTTATFRLIAQTQTAARPDHTPPATVATGPREPTLPATTTTAATGARDPASPAAAAAMAKGFVERSLADSATLKIIEPVVAKRIEGGNFVNGVKRPRYQAEVVVEIPRGFGTPIQGKYFVTVQYVGGGEWVVESTGLATKY